jgi:hypothetical protein
MVHSNESSQFVCKAIQPIQRLACFVTAIDDKSKTNETSFCWSLFLFNVARHRREKMLRTKKTPCGG